MSLQIGQQAPTFTLPEAPGQTVDVDAKALGTPVVVLFIPLAFSPVCTEELCRFRDDWSRWNELGAAVFAVSVDSPFVVQRFREAEGIPFPVLSDFNKDVSSRFGALHEELLGLKGVSKRAAFVIDPSGTISYAWVSDDPSKQVEFEAIEGAVAATAG